MILIKNGLLHTMSEQGTFKGDILLADGKIKEIGTSLTVQGDVEVIDAEGQMVFPGFIDAHTHLGLWEDAMGFEGADGNSVQLPRSARSR